MWWSDFEEWFDEDDCLIEGIKGAFLNFEVILLGEGGI